MFYTPSFQTRTHTNKNTSSVGRSGDNDIASKTIAQLFNDFYPEVFVIIRN